MPGRTSPVRALLLDVSRSGLFVKGSSDIELGAQVVVRFRLRPHGWCEANGTVVRRTQVVRMHGFAVQFDQVHEAWREFVDDLSKLASGKRRSFVVDVLGPLIELRERTRSA